MLAREFVTEAPVWKRYKNNPRRLYYKGYRCTKDCSGHKAGYRWAKGKKIRSTQQCPDTVNNSFYEGCLSCAQGR